MTDPTQQPINNAPAQPEQPVEHTDVIDPDEDVVDPDEFPPADEGDV